VRKMWALVDQGEFHLQISSSGTYHISIRVLRARVVGRYGNSPDCARKISPFDPYSGLFSSGSLAAGLQECAL
jgi:hypothetical protein